MSILGWLTVAIVLHVALFADTQVQANDSGLIPRSAEQWAGPWVEFDSWEYITISERAYHRVGDERTRAVWFPGYAVTIAAVHQVIHPVTGAAVAAAAMGGLVAVAFFGRWLYWFGDRKTIGLSLAIGLLYPYAWFLYGGAYSTPQFVAFAIGAFLALESKRTKLAGLLGAAALATHPMGLALLVGLLAREAELQGVLITRPLEPPSTTPRWRRLPFVIDRNKIFAMRPILLTPILGLVAYMVFLGITVGDPSLWLTARSAHSSGFLRDSIKVDFVTRMITWSDPQRLMTTVIQAIFVAIVVHWIPAIGRRFGWGYSCYVAALVAMVIVGTADFNGSGRYLLAAFPVAAIAGERLKGRTLLAGSYLVISAALLVMLTLLFGRTWYLT